MSKIEKALAFVAEALMSKDRNCIQSALIVRDFLQGIGIPAEAKSVGAYVRALQGERQLNAVGCGAVLRSMCNATTRMADAPDGWDGHLVVTTRDWLIDPTFSQFRRAQWDWTPDVALVRKLAHRQKFSLPDGTEKRVLAVVMRDDETTGVHFDAFWIGDPANAAWMAAPAARPDRRRDHVKELVKVWKEHVIVSRRS